MSTNSDALQLAHWLEHELDPEGTVRFVAAAELRRLHADERRLRRMLSLRSGIPHLYCDDGEASGQEHGISIDFLREPVADIEAKLLALNLARFRVAEGAA